MTWLTRAELRRDEPSQKALARILLDEGARDVGHRLVWSLFAEDPEAKRDFLYREAEAGRYLILSERPPSDPRGLWQIRSKAYEPQLVAGLRVGFALRANPAQSVKVAGRERGARVDAVMHAKKHQKAPFGSEEVETAALAWLFAREAKLGVTFDRVRCSAGGYHQARVIRNGAPPIRHSVIDFEGVLEVVDAVALSAALAAGVGRAKAYGCGLLLLRPLAS